MHSTTHNSRCIISYSLIPLAILLLVSCASFGSGKTGSSSNAVIDFVNFVRLGGIMYLVSTDNSTGRSLQPHDIGSVFGTITHKLEGNVQDPNYHAQNGDAAFLDVGTKLYRLKHYAPTFRLAAYVQGHIQVYEADTNPYAKRGADLLDIAGKVQSIDINSADDGVTVLAALHDAKQIASLVSMIMQASVNQQMLSDGTQYFLVFHLLDGTTVTRVLWTSTGELSRGIMLPHAFVAEIEQAVQHHER